MNMETRVQIFKKAIIILHNTNALGENINPTILPFSYG